jgi:hypothetical protein
MIEVRPNRVRVSLPSFENRNRSSFRNVVFSSILTSGRWAKFRNLVILNIFKHALSGTIIKLEMIIFLHKSNQQTNFLTSRD